MKKQMTELGVVLTKALENKKENIDCFVWRTKEGEEIRLMDMGVDELQKAYTHVNDMLYNVDKYTPGRLQVKKNIKVFIAHCNAELMRRYLLHDCNIDILKNNLQIVDFIRNHKSANKLTDDDDVTSIFTNIPKEFETVKLGELLFACLDNLQIINRKMISDKFVLSQGIWLTEEEKEELTEYDYEGNRIPWLDVIANRLLLNNVKLKVNSKGFSYSEFRSLVHLKPLSKISMVPTNTLILLRDKVFLLLDNDNDYHIKRWEKIKTNIEKVADYKKITLFTKNYAN